MCSTLNSVLVAVCGGLAPLAWGGMLDILGRWHTGGNGPLPFAVFFGVSCGLSVLAQCALNRVYEPAADPAVTLIAKLFSDWPLRVVSAFLTLGKRDW